MCCTCLIREETTEKQEIQRAEVRKGQTSISIHKNNELCKVMKIDYFAKGQNVLFLLTAAPHNFPTTHLITAQKHARPRTKFPAYRQFTMASR